MPWPKVELVGGITVRERPQKHEGQPRYKRLDFIRSKGSGEDTHLWPVVRSTQADRAITAHEMYAGPEYPYHQGQLHGPGLWHQDQFLTHGPMQLPALPPTPGMNFPAMEWPHQPQHQLEGPNNGHPAVVMLGPAHSDDQFSDGSPSIVDRAPKKKKKSKSKKKSKLPADAPGYSIFGDSSSDESPVKRDCSRARFRGRSRSTGWHEFAHESRPQSRARGW